MSTSDHAQGISHAHWAIKEIIVNINNLDYKHKDDNNRINSAINKHTHEISTLDSNITNVNDRAVASDISLSTRIDLEEQRAKSSETSLDTEISNEVARATNNEDRLELMMHNIALGVNPHEAVFVATGENGFESGWTWHDGNNLDFKNGEGDYWLYHTTGPVTIGGISIQNDTDKRILVRGNVNGWTNGVYKVTSNANEPLKLTRTEDSDNNEGSGYEFLNGSFLYVTDGDYTNESYIAILMTEDVDKGEHNEFSWRPDICNVQFKLFTKKEDINETLSNMLYDEITRAASSELSLENRLSTVEERAGASESSIETRLGEEEVRAESSESSLDTRLNTEEERAKSSESSIEIRLSNEEVRAVASESSLANDITSEITRATSSESSLENRLSTEEERAVNEEQKLDKRISNVSMGISSHEAVYVTTGDTGLTGNSSGSWTWHRGLTDDGNEYFRSGKGDYWTSDGSTATIDGETLSNTGFERVLVRGELDGSKNGIYTNQDNTGSTVKLVRSEDSDNNEGSRYEFRNGSFVYVQHGTDYANKTYVAQLDGTDQWPGDNGEYSWTPGACDVQFNLLSSVGDINDSIANYLREEVDRAKDSETSLDSKIDVETNRATASETSLSTAVNTETTRARASETSLNSKIESETSRAKSSEASLNSKIDVETNRATASEASLDSKIDDETSRAKSSETSLDSKIDDETSRAKSSETSLSTAISTEESRAKSSEISLSTAISTETTRAQASEESINVRAKDAESSLDTKITTLEFGINAHPAVDIATDVNELESSTDWSWVSGGDSESGYDDTWTFTGSDTTIGGEDISNSGYQRILVRGNTNGQTNGIYKNHVNIGGDIKLIRSTDSDNHGGDYEFMNGSFVFVEKGNYLGYTYISHFIDTDGSHTKDDGEYKWNVGCNVQFDVLSSVGDINDTVKNYLKNEIDRAKASEISLSTAVSTETTRATASESSLSTAISTETTRAKDSETSLSTAISTETARAQDSETSLSTAVSTETTRAKESESSLATAVSTETTRAKDSETSLSTAISTETSRAKESESSLATAVSTETTRAKDSETSLSTAISTETARAQDSETSLSTAVSTETTRAKESESSLATAVSTETTRAKDSETSLSTAISTETARAQDSETSLSTAVSTETTRAKESESSLATAVSTETTRAKDSETSLSTAISTETARAQDSETSLSTAVSTETTRAKESESSLETAVSTETTRAKDSETSLSTAISTETTRAKDSETSLSTAISTETTRATASEALLDSKINDETSRAKASESSLETTITTLGEFIDGGDVTIDGIMTAKNFVSTSDESLKINIETLENKSFYKLFDLEPVSYNWKGENIEDKEKDIGFIAQKVGKFFPNLVHIEKDGKMGIKYDKLSVYLTQALKEQNKELETYKKRLETLEKIIVHEFNK